MLKGGLEIPQIPKKANNNSVPVTGVPISIAFPSSTATNVPVINKAVKPPKPKQPKKPKDEKPEVSGLGTLTLPFNGLGALLPPPIGLNMTTPTTPQARKRKSGVDKPKTPKTPGNQNEPPKANEDTKGGLLI